MRLVGPGGVWWMVTAALAVAAVYVLPVQLASAASNPPLLAQTPPDGQAGSGAGELNLPHALAADPTNGHIYVAEGLNARISEFTAWGKFVKAFGWGVSDGSNEAQTCTASCEAGKEGTGAGQFSRPSAVAVDALGNVYVVDRLNSRVEKFNSTGQFLLMFGGEVNKTSGANVCTATDVTNGDECGAGTEGVGAEEFSNLSVGTLLATGPSGNVYVGDANRIHVFSPAGALVEEINFSEITGLPAGGDVRSLTVDESGHIYFDFAQDCVGVPTLPGVYELAGGSHEIATKLNVDCPKALDLDSQEDLYVAASFHDPNREEMLEFNKDGECLVCLGDGFARAPADGELKGVITTEACGPIDIYASFYLNEQFGDESYFDLYGPPPNADICPPPPVPPTIADQFAAAVGTETATLRAAINPHFWPDTTYYLEWGAENCATSACTAQPLPPGASLGGQVIDAPVTTNGILLHGLSPGTTYHYRFVAQSSGGGPVFGADRTFTTFPSTQRPPDSCANAPFRVGLGAALPDCRAYEMVSPLEKNGGNILALKNVFGYPAAMNQSDLAGSKLTYSSARSFGDAQSSPYTSQYLATRTAGGWSTQGISPPRNGPIFERGQTTDTEFKAFSPDLCLAWLRHDTDPPLSEGAPEGFAGLYRRDNCPEASYGALRTPAPPSTPAENYEPELQGYSADGETAIFVANDALTVDAPAIPSGQIELYESKLGEEPKYVCILPNETPDTGGCSAGTYNPGGGFGRSASVQGAISEDGSRIFWSDSSLGEGKLYLRVDGAETRAVSAFAEGKSKTKASQFWAAAADGSAAIFTTGENLYEYNVESSTSAKIAGKVKGLMGVSKDASHLYFVSEEALEGAAVAGKPNLYLSVRSGEEHQIIFIMQVSAADAAAETLQQTPSPVNVEPVKHTARVTPDGGALAFTSTVRPTPTGFDNTDVQSGEPDAEAYLYDAASEELRCVSCNRTGARPQGEELEVGGFKTGIWAAGEIAPWENQLYAPRVISDTGDRLFFASTEPLVGGDTNDELDVYQWEAPGTGGCSEGAGSYVPQTGGCVDLISSGESPFRSEFIDATPSGDDVFFGTLASLVPQDYGLVDIYDARAGGGFPPSPVSPGECEGASCQSPPPPPAPQSLASAGYVGPGTHAPPKKKSCPKGRKAKCAKKKHNRHRARGSSR
jgi:DNA-binding beta-propeller fold protein YncE